MLSRNSHCIKCSSTAICSGRGRAQCLRSVQIRTRWSLRTDITACCTQQQGPAQAQTARLQPFPASYEQVVRQAQEACKAAIADGSRLLEVEFPCASLESVSGDADGETEMNKSLSYMRQFLGAWRDDASNIRVFLPDAEEIAVARNGVFPEASTGQSNMDATFPDAGPPFQMGYLTRQSLIWAVFGFNPDKFSPVSLVVDSDKMFVVGYPYFNMKEELSATFKIWSEKAVPRDAPLIIFNGELDRVREGYYWSFAYSDLAKINNEMLPSCNTAYYIHNFKGSKPGVLFRVYPGPWQVLRRNPRQSSGLRVVWSSETRPTLKQVATEILPNSS